MHPGHGRSQAVARLYGVAALSYTAILARPMTGRAVLATLKTYVAMLVVTILFPILWLRSVRFAREHESLDPKAVPKVAAAIVMAVILLAGAVVAVQTYREDAQQGIYDSLENRMSAAVGNAKYNEWVDLEDAAADRVETAQKRLAESQAAGDEENITVWQNNLQNATRDRGQAQENVTALEGNQRLFQDIQAALARQDDAEAKRLIASRSVDHPDLEQNAARAFEIKDDAVADMAWFYNWLVYPGLVGVFFAPLVWAMGSLLRAGFEPSETVGFKPYPHGAMAVFLFLGAFGVPALFFSAWAFMDIRQRHEEGQIEL